MFTGLNVQSGVPAHPPATQMIVKTNESKKAIRKVMKTKDGSAKMPLTKLQLGCEKRVCMLLISKGRVAGVYPTPHLLAKEAASC